MRSGRRQGFRGLWAWRAALTVVPGSATGAGAVAGTLAVAGDIRAVAEVAAGTRAVAEVAGAGLAEPRPPME